MRPRTKRIYCDTVPTPIRPAIASVFRSCKLKRVHETPEAAQRDVDNIHRAGRDTNPDYPLRPYKCDTCFGWHVGHDTRIGRMRPHGTTH